MSSLRLVTVLSVALTLLLALQSASAADEHFESGLERVPLVELYTSEGCSSCPPADRWLSTLVDDPELFETFVPIGFHVDYWNYIGWDDRFSSPEFSSRQRRYIDEGAARIVYTPGVFVGGEEWLGWRRGKAFAEPGQTVGNLSARIENSSVLVRFEPQGSSINKDRLDVHVVVLGMALETEVRAGENRGRKLRHDFVALEHSMTRARARDGVFEARLEPGLEHDAPGLAIAVWVAESGSQQPVQATGGLIAAR